MLGPPLSNYPTRLLRYAIIQLNTEYMALLACVGQILLFVWSTSSWSQPGGLETYYVRSKVYHIIVIE
jgi:hypothetical protein